VAGNYLDHLLLEIDLLARHLPHRRRLSQMHFGGGTPTYYPVEDLTRLHRHIAERFQFTDDAEVAIEVDPRVTTHEHISALARLGFNRLSVGVQDFDLVVQEAVHRVQSYESTADLLAHARAAGFGSVNVDLIFGLPFQTTTGFRRTLEQVLEIRPDRVAVYSFAFVPWMKGHMRTIPQESLPDAPLKLELLASAIDAFTGAGYRAIGMDHFALPDDELARAVEAGTLSRNFMGYTVQSAHDMVATGVSGIGDVQGAYLQNHKKLPPYYEALEQGRFPIERGCTLDDDDLLRRHVITQIMCNARLSFADVEARFPIRFREYFAAELAALVGPDSPGAHGMVDVDDAGLRVTPIGRLFVRNVAMVFDRYLPEALKQAGPVFSRTV
jgi:oxygen-independent coproporphyrinogen-3 oxidase